MFAPSTNIIYKTKRGRRDLTLSVQYLRTIQRALDALLCQPKDWLLGYAGNVAINCVVHICIMSHVECEVSPS